MPSDDLDTHQRDPTETTQKPWGRAGGRGGTIEKTWERASRKTYTKETVRVYARNVQGNVQGARNLGSLISFYLEGANNSGRSFPQIVEWKN